MTSFTRSLIFRTALCLALFNAILLCSAEGKGQDVQQAPGLRIDPLLVAQATEVWNVIARPDNPIWPGWNAAETPLLFYLPGAQDVLINHPKAPAGFRKYNGPVKMGDALIQVRDGRTFFEFDGQNTTLDVEGVRTLVVADTLSNRRSQVKSWLADPRPAPVKSEELSWEQLQGNPYDHLTMIAHEAFHAFQRKQAPEKAGGESALQRYPTIAVNNTVGFALEGDYLAAALRATMPSEFRQCATRWLATRQQRRKNLSAEAISYEDRMEYLEGLAKYVEYRLLQVLEGRPFGPAMAWVQGFNGYANLRPQREALINQLVKMMRGEANVNNDPYGASPLRMRLYYSGMAIGVMLDQLDPAWKQHIFERDETLTGLATKALKLTDDELASTWEEISNQPKYDTLRTQKTRLEKEGTAATQKALEEIKSGPNTLLVVDYSALGDAQATLSFTPFGTLRIDDDRTIYRLVPIRANIAGVTLRQTKPVPMLHDRSAKQLSCQLQELLPVERINSLFAAKTGQAEPVALNNIALPGVTLNSGQATITADGRRLFVRLAPSK